uniref:Uncharacterized protein n=1 Tax=Canis lupus familiaris TaxID=9615 RepID=A0A8C0NZK2_CANLF
MGVRIHACDLEPCVIAPFQADIKGVWGELALSNIYTHRQKLACGEGLLFFNPIFLHFFFFLFFILEFVALWELRPRDHLRSWKISFLTSCHMICLILSQWKWHIGTKLHL